MVKKKILEMDLEKGYIIFTDNPKKKFPISNGDIEANFDTKVLTIKYKLKEEIKMRFDLTKEEVEYILHNIRVDVDNYMENKSDCVPKKVKYLQEEKIIPEVVWKKAIIGSDCYGNKELLEKLFKKLIKGKRHSSQP